MVGDNSAVLSKIAEARAKRIQELEQQLAEAMQLIEWAADALDSEYGSQSGSEILWSFLERVRHPQ
jgi:hypothetical protein